MTEYIPQEPSAPVVYDAPDGDSSLRRIHLARETALEVVVNGRSHSLLMQTPGAETDLLVGYLFTEGLIDAPDQIHRITLGPAGEFLGAQMTRAEVDIPGLDVTVGLPDRPTVALSSCGLCGKEALNKLGRGMGRVKSRQRFRWSSLLGIMGDLRRHQPLYDQTRGVHAAALYNPEGGFEGCAEDVGRHNALDKVIGRSLLENRSLDDKLVLLSGRASLEMVLKTARAGLPVLLCLSSPTLLAVEAAKQLNLTLVARRDDRFLAGYTHTRRLED